MKQKIRTFGIVDKEVKKKSSGFRSKLNDYSSLFRQKFIEFWSITKITVCISICAVIASAAIAGYVALRELYQNKLKDTWSVLFLNFEQLGSEIQLNLHKCCTPGSSLRKDSGLFAHYQIGSNRRSPITRIDGNMPEKLRWQELGLKQAPTPQTWNTVNWGGQLFTLLVSRRDVYIWNANPSTWLESKKSSNQTTKVYAITKSGLLIFSNSDEINQTTLLDRRLVASFINKRITNGQIEITEKEDFYGFFQEIPNTNIIIFAETSKSRALSIVWIIIQKYSFVLIGILAFSTILVGALTAKILTPISELATLAKAIGQGDLSKIPKQRGVGELGPLIESFRIMISNLNQRDRAISQLMEDRLHKLRMSHELAIAKNLQDTFINSFVDGLPLHLNASLFSKYEAAEECAGDWYASHLDHEHNCLTIAIADVSGHGVSSAMFTAIIAALYDERINGVSQNHLDLFEAIHLRLRHLAPDRMHATFQIVTWFPDEKLLKITNAGHPFPLLERDEKGVRTSEMIKMMSTPLGIFDSPVTSSVTISVPEGFRLLLYTDGLTEGRSEELGVVFGNKKLKEAFTDGPSVNGEQRVDYIMQRWRNHMGKRAASDDICLLLLEARNSDSRQKIA